MAFYRRVGVGPTFGSFGVATALDAASNIVFQEFDIVHKLRKLFGKP